MFNDSSLNFISANNQGWENYSIRGDFLPMDIRYNPQCGIVELKGSPLCFAQGHNLIWNEDLFTQAIREVGETTGIIFFDSIVLAIEYGIIVNIQKNSREIIKGNFGGNGLKKRENSKDNGFIRYFFNKKEKVENKLYDPIRNATAKVGLSKKKLLALTGWDKDENFIKFECHNKFPKSLFGKEITLQNLLFTDICLRLMCEKSLFADIDLKKVFPQFLDCISKGVLTANDKSARMRTFKKSLGKITIPEKSSYNILELLKESLELD